MFRNTTLSDKIMVLGIDGLDPRYTARMVREGKMPAFKELIERGAAREDLMCLGGCAPVTPPGWATLSTGAYSYTHGICQFFGFSAEKMDKKYYQLDSRVCKAEQSWNCTADAGLKTCVFHWPGASWPPTSDSENLFVIDGTVPGSPGMAAFYVEGNFFFGASTTVEVPEYIKGVQDTTAPCVVEKLPEALTDDAELAAKADVAKGVAISNDLQDFSLVRSLDEGWGIRQGRFPQAYDVCKSYLRPAEGWTNAPEGAMEFVVLLSNTLIRRPGLVLKNEEGKYDRIAIYKSKKDVEPMCVIKEKEFYRDFIDEGFRGDNKCVCARDIYVMEIAEDGTNIRLYFSSCAAIDDDSVIHPKWLHQELMENVGPYPPTAQFYGQDEEHQLIQVLCWEHVADWYVKAIDYLIEKQDMQIFFSHWHGCDLMVHTFIRYFQDQGYNKFPPEHINKWMERVYALCDKYIGSFLHYLDEGWTIIVTSDHGLTCPANEPPAIGDMCGINIGLMEELGYTVMKEGKGGKKEIDWTKTRAIAEQGGNIWINLKGRSEVGIVDPEDKYELEEQIMTDLLGYRHPVTGKRVLAVALRNKDAIQLGYGGPTAGDIFTANADGYAYDHTDGLMTNHGVNDTSLAPIMILAGKGIKKGYTIDRMIRQVDMAPTICAMTGSRFTDTMEGAPMYCILEQN